MQNNVSALRRQVEAELGDRVPAALSPVLRTEKFCLPLADARLTNLIDGGVPLGAITEVHGPLCSGKTSFAFSLTAKVTQSCSVAAWVDVADTFDPEAAALSGVDLQRLLWVRCDSRASGEQLASSEVPTQTTSAQSSMLVAANYTPKPVGNGGCGSSHPRSEGKDMAEAIDSLLLSQPRSAASKQRRLNKAIGTPGAPNRKLTATEDMVSTNGNLFGRQVSRKGMPFPHASPYREEQVPTDRQPSRRTKESIPFQAKAETELRNMSSSQVRNGEPALVNRWAPLDQALRSVDLLLQAGGFSLIVLDLSHIPINMVWRIPLATWFRFRSGCERSRSSLLVLSQHSCARASADLTVASVSHGFQTLGANVVVGGLFGMQVEQKRRDTSRQPLSNVVPFRKSVLPDKNCEWATASPWSVRA